MRRFIKIVLTLVAVLAAVLAVAAAFVYWK
jgi:hypothetical protein